MVLTPDLGTGVGTIRPAKKVDPVGSLELSSEFVGSLRKEGSPTSSLAPPRCASSETARVGGLMVDEVILPILNNVRSPHNISFRGISQPTSGSRLSGMIWMPEKLNL